MTTLKRIIQATIFVVLHAALAVLFMAYVNPSWLVGCGILAAAFATLMLFVFAADEKRFFRTLCEKVRKEQMKFVRY